MSHDFNKSLAASHAAEDMPFWEETYRKAFPTMVAMINHRQDGDHQRLGIDRSIILSNSKQITIDEKVRFRNKKTGKVYKDIALEYLSDRDRKVPGWVCKPLMCDYIAYAIAPLGECYMLPVIQLQAAWQQHKEVWMEYRTIEANNKCNGRGWVTLSKPVKIDELLSAIGDCLCVSFTPFEDAIEKQVAPQPTPTKIPHANYWNAKRRAKGLPPLTQPVKDGQWWL